MFTFLLPHLIAPLCQVLASMVQAKTNKLEKNSTVLAALT